MEESVQHVIPKHSSSLVCVLLFISVLLNALSLIRFVPVYFFFMTSYITVSVHHHMGGKLNEEKQN